MRRVLYLLVLALALTPSPARADDLFIPGAPVDPAATAALVDSVYTLSDVDAFTGMFLGDVSSPVVGSDSISFLMDANALAFDAQRVAEEARAEMAARRQAEEQRISDAARARAAAAQTEVGPDGCPTSVPPRTLRGGSEEIGSHVLCVSSVASAPTPAAAQAIKFIFSNLGIPYTRSDRMGPNGFDCSSFVMRAYDSAGVPVISNGWAPTTHTIAPYPGYSSFPWLVTVSYKDALPGDLLLRPQSETRSDGGGHVAMLLDMGFMAHTAAVGDVSHITKAYDEDDLFNIRRVSP
jgi:cell wall-associated NlpC family hydrolase